MWKDLSEPWKKAVELAWLSYNRGTVPIGAVITDVNGNIVSEGRNRIFDKESSHILSGTYMAHAEMTAMCQIKEDEHPDIRSYILYTTMEPCPMCFGTMLMMHFGKMVYGCHDKFAGATELKDKSEYTKRKSMQIEFAGGELEVFQLALQTAFELERNHARVEDILKAWKETDRVAVELGRKLWDQRFFNKGKSIGVIFDSVIRLYEEMAIYRDDVLEV